MHRRLLIFILFIISIGLCAKYEVYHDGAQISSNLSSPKRGIFDTSFKFTPLNVMNVFGVDGDLKDIQFASSFILALIDENLYILYVDFYDKTFYSYIYPYLVRPYAMNFKQNVHFISMFEVDESKAYYAYVKTNGICFGVLNAGDNWKEFIEESCFEVSYELTSIKKIDVSGYQEAYLWISGNLQKVSVIEGTLAHYLVANSVELFSYPIIHKHGKFGVEYIDNTELIDPRAGVYPVAISSIKETGAFAVQYTNGDIRGYMMENQHTAFENACSTINEYCTFLGSTSISGISLTSNSFAYFPEEDKISLKADTGFSQTLDIDINGTAKIMTLGRYGAGFMYFVKDDSKVLMYRLLYKDPLVYLFDDVDNSFQKVRSFEEEVQRVIPCYQNVYFLMKNGDLYNEANELLHQNVVDAILFDIQLSSIIYTDKKDVYSSTEGKLTFDPGLPIGDIEKIDSVNLSQAFHLVIKVNNHIYLYAREGDASYSLAYTFEADEFISVHINNNFVIRKGENYYCSSEAFCCSMDGSKSKLQYTDHSDLAPKYTSQPVNLSILSSEITKAVSFNVHLMFLSKYGQVYTCPLHNGGEVLRVGIADPDMKVCDIFTFYLSNAAYMRMCNLDVYYYGVRANDRFEMDDNGVISDKSSDFPQLHKFEGIPGGYKLIESSGSLYSSFLIFENTISCEQNASCIIENVQVNNNTILLPNSTDITISGPSVIGNSTLIVQGSKVIIKDQFDIKNSTIVYQNNGNNDPIVVNGGGIYIESSTFVYEVSSEELYNSIQNGDVLTIITTGNGGEIIGEFEDIELKLPEGMETCKEIKVESKYE